MVFLLTIIAACGTGVFPLEAPIAPAPTPPPAHGALDTTFGRQGEVITDFAGSVDGANAMALQPDGKIVAAGFATVSGKIDFALARYNTDGSLDASFAGTGLVTTPISASGIDSAYGVAVQADGKIVAVGTSDEAGTPSLAVVRYNADGTIDVSGFNAAGSPPGIVTLSFGSGPAQGRAVAVQPADGLLVVTGTAWNGTDYDIAIARLQLDGTLDTAGFNAPNGFAITATSPGGNDWGASIAVQGDSKIVIGGTSNLGPGSGDFALVRYTASGLLDTKLGGSGKVTTLISAGQDQGRAVALQPDGKILLAGSTTVGAAKAFAAVRYSALGALDSTFGAGGIFTASSGFGDGGASAMGLQSDGSIVLAGGATSGTSAVFALMRLTGVGALDTTFGTGGIVSTAFDSGLDLALGLLIQPADRKIVVGGQANGVDFALARYLP